MMLLRNAVYIVLICFSVVASACGSAPVGPVKLRVGVSLTPEELKDFQPALEELDKAHPEWELVLEQVPQAGNLEKLTANAAAGTLPDVQYVFNNQVRRFIAQGAFLDLQPLLDSAKTDLSDYYPNLFTQFRYTKDGKAGLYGIPTNAAPEVLFYNKDLFDTAGVPYPTDGWTVDDLRAAARKLTRDTAGRDADDPAFDKANVVQWGWYGAFPGGIFSRNFLTTFGVDWCADADCMKLDLTSPKVLEAIQFWADMVQQDGSTLSDTFRGTQTGAPGDPFISGKAAMGMSGWFAIGQLNTQGSFAYDVVQPVAGPTGKRASQISAAGYAISAKTQHPDEALKLVLALNSPEFLTRVWAKPGHALPARKSVAMNAVDTSHPPANQAAAIKAMDYAEPFAPYTSGAFEAYLKTVDTFIAAMKGDQPLATAMQEIESTANDFLQKAGP